MKSLAKILLPLAFLSMPLAASAQTPKPTYFKIGTAVSQSHNSSIKSNFKTPIGYELVIGKELLPELTAEISESQVWAKEINNSGYKQRISLLGIGPNILWTPEFNGAKGLYFGGGVKYKILKSIWTPEPINGFSQNEKSESVDGLGFSIKFGNEFNLGKRAKLYIETEYDQAKIDRDGEKTDIGTTKLSLGIRF